MSDLCHVVPAGLDDIDDLVSLENKVFTSDRISRRQFRYLLTKSHGALFKVLCNNVFAGYIAVLQRKKSTAMRIYSLAVAPEFRQQGIGSKLLDHVEMLALRDNCCSIALEVCEKNVNALAMYLARAFAVTGTKENYYEDGCTALKLMKRMLCEGN